MKILKKNQLIILIISLMLVTAGYLNFTSTNYPLQENKDVVADLGDATLVNSNNLETDSLSENIEENIESKEENINQEIESVENSDIQETVQTQTEDTYFITSKLERENIYSQMLESYQEIYNNANATAEQKNVAIQEISRINQTRNSIMIAENLVKAKGLEDIVIFANSNSVSVIVKAEILEPEQIAQIQNIISRELEVSAETINISTK